MKEAIRRGFEINPTDKNRLERMNQLPDPNKTEEVRLFFKAADLKNDLIWLRIFDKRREFSLERLEMKLYKDQKMQIVFFKGNYSEMADRYEKW